MEGIVVSDKMEKTVIVKVARKSYHRLYKKIIARSTKLKVHDPQKKAKIGDRVKIVESRPYSKDTHFRLLEIV